MKTIILVFLLSVMAFGQAGGAKKSVLTPAQKDSIGAMISDSLSGFSGTYTLSGIVREVGTGRDYTTIASAITASSAWDIIRVFGTSNETITVTKNLILDLQNGKINYTANNTSSTINLTSGDTLIIYGGEVRREYTTSSGYALDNAGVLKIYDTDISLLTTSAIPRRIINNSGTIFINNDYIGEDRGKGYFYSTGGEVYLNAKLAKFIWYFSDTKAIMNIDHIIADNSLTASYYNTITGGSNVRMNIKKTECTDNGVLYSYFPSQLVQDTSKFYFEGNYNFITGLYQASEGTLFNAWNEEGKPRLDPGLNGISRVINCNLKYVYPSFVPRQTSGEHMFEGDQSDTTAYPQLFIENSVLQWGRETTVGDTAKEYGSMIYFARGRIEISNSHLIDYGNDYGYGDMLSPINTYADHTYINSTFDYYEPAVDTRLVNVYIRAGTNPIRANNYARIRFQNCVFNRFNDELNVGTKSTFILFNAYRPITSNDIIIFDGCTYSSSAGATPRLFQYAQESGGNAMTMETFWDSVTTNQTPRYENLLNASRIYTKGGGESNASQYLQNDQRGTTLGNVLMSDGYKFPDTLSRAGVDLDTGIVRIDFIKAHGFVSGSLYNARAWLDANLGIRVSTGIRYSMEDVRIVTSDFSGAIATQFNVDSIKTHASFTRPTIALKTATQTYLEFYIINNYSASIGVDIWLRQSLNVKKITSTRQ